MTASLKGCRAKLRHAEHHLQIVEDKIASFRERYPVRITVDCDVNQPAYVFHVWDVREPDLDWGLIIGDAAHNARSALDHLAYQLLIVGLGRDLTDADPEAQRIMFPVFEDPGKFRSNGERRIAGLRDVDRARIEELQPYNAWDEGIWGPHQMPGPPAPVATYLGEVSRLDNADKHRIVQPVWFTAGFCALPKNPRELGITGGSSTDRPLGDGAEIGRWFFDRIPPDPPDEMKVHMNAYFPTQVSLREPFFGTCVGRILSNCIIAVRMVLDMFEPVVSHGQDPAPLRYWDGQPPWL
jgi:hypothetical protein